MTLLDHMATLHVLQASIATQMFAAVQATKSDYCVHKLFVQSTTEVPIQKINRAMLSAQQAL